MLAELERRFAAFRAEHPRGTRVPGELRAAALDALRRGVTATELYRACGVSRAQIGAWEGRARTSPRRTAASDAEEDVRVFSVVDAEATEGPGSGGLPQGELELRLGPWSVRVRNEGWGPGTSGRG